MLNQMEHFSIIKDKRDPIEAVYREGSQSGFLE